MEAKYITYTFVLPKIVAGSIPVREYVTHGACSKNLFHPQHVTLLKSSVHFQGQWSYLITDL